MNTNCTLRFLQSVAESSYLCGVEQELRVCLLIKAQFKPSEIAILTAHSKEAITSTRRRLYKKMTGLDGTPEMLDEMILRV